MKSNEKEFISLKEAAEMSGYSPDYIGQLIRSGKLPGKQVFLNVAWVTTKEAIDVYMSKDKKGKGKILDAKGNVFTKLASPAGLSKLFNVVGGFFVAMLFLVLIVFSYVLAVSIDHRINSSYLEKIEYVR